MNYEDSPDDQQEWNPPSYATAVEKTGEAWKPPEYAKVADVKPPETEKDKIKKTQTFASTFKDAVGHTKEAIDDFIKDTISKDPSKRSVVQRMIMSQNPTEESVLPALKEPDTYWGGFRKGLYDSFIRPLGSAAGAAGLITGEEGLKSPSAELPIRQTAREIPYRMGDSVQKAEPKIQIGDKSPLQTKADKIVSRMDPRGPEPTDKLPALEANKGVLQAKADEILKQTKPSQEIPIKQEVKRLTPEPETPPTKKTFVNPFEKKEPSNILAAEQTGRVAPFPSKAKNLFEISQQIKQHANSGEIDGIMNRAYQLIDEYKTSSQAKTDYQEIMHLVDTASNTNEAELFQDIADTIKEKGNKLNADETKGMGQIRSLSELKNKFRADTSDDKLYDLAREKFNMGKDWTPPSYAQPSAVKTPEVVDKMPSELEGVKSPSKITEEPKSFSVEDSIKALDRLEKENPNAGSLSEKEYDDLHAKYLKQIQDEKSSGDDIVEMHGGLGGVGGGKKRNLPPSTGPVGPVLDKLFQATLDAKDKVVQQEIINKAERAKRFAAFADTKGEGTAWASKALSNLKGEYNKVNPGEALQLKPQETDSLFTAVKNARLTDPEKARGASALFKILNGERVVRSDLAVLDDVFGNNFANRITEMHGGIGAVGLQVSKLANTWKSLQNMLSLAPALRHGSAGVLTKEFYPAARDMIKFMTNKEYYDAARQAIKEDPHYLPAKETGLFLSKPGNLANSEEEFLNSYIGDLPTHIGRVPTVVPQLVGASQRGYSGFLDKFRFDIHKNMSQTAKSLGHDIVDITPLKDKNGNPILDDNGKPKVDMTATKTGKAISRLINTATGRGSLDFSGGKDNFMNLNKITNELNMLLWSPRMMVSRFQMFNPKLYTNLPKGMRLDGLKLLLGSASLGLAVDGLALAGGAKIGTNILSSDFMKARFKDDHVIDGWSGYQQMIVAAARFLRGKTDSSIPTSRGEIAGRFLANKESPAASLAHALAFAKEYTGKMNNPPNTLKDIGQATTNFFGSPDPKKAGSFTTQYGQKTSIQHEAFKQFKPIFEQDIEDLIASEPKWSENIGLTAAMAAASLAGMAQSYPEKKKLSLGKMKF